MISKEVWNLYNISYNKYIRARKEKKDKDKARALNEMRGMYDKHLFKKLVDLFQNQ